MRKAATGFMALRLTLTSADRSHAAAAHESMNMSERKTLRTLPGGGATCEAWDPHQTAEHRSRIFFRNTPYLSASALTGVGVERSRRVEKRHTSHPFRRGGREARCEVSKKVEGTRRERGTFKISLYVFCRRMFCIRSIVSFAHTGVRSF